MDLRKCLPPILVSDSSAGAGTRANIDACREGGTYLNGSIRLLLLRPTAAVAMRLLHSEWSLFSSSAVVWVEFYDAGFVCVLPMGWFGGVEVGRA